MYIQFQHRARPGRAFAAVLVVAVAGWVAAKAEDAPVAPAPASAGSNGSATAAVNPAANLDTGGNDLGILEQFLRQSPEQISRLRKALDYLDNMTPAQRDVLLRDLQARQQSITALRTEISADMRQLSTADQGILRRYWVTLFPEDIQALLKRFQDAGTNADARKALIQEMLKAAADKGIRATPNNPGDRGPGPGGPQRGGPPGSRGRAGGGPRGSSAATTTASAASAGK